MSIFLTSNNGGPILILLLVHVHTDMVFMLIIFVVNSTELGARHSIDTPKARVILSIISSIYIHLYLGMTESRRRKDQVFILLLNSKLHHLHNL